MLLLDLLPGCEDSQVLRIIYFIKELFHVLFILIPILLIIILSVDMAKNVVATKEENMKKNVTIFLKRLLFCIAMFLIEPIVSLVIGLLGNTNLEYITCLELATKETIAEVSKTELESESVAEEQNKIAEEQGVKDFLDSLEQNDKSGNNTTGNYTGGSNNNTKETKTYGNSTDKPIKVLLMGNSLTYVNGYGEILTRMAKKTGKKIVVVMATKGGKAGMGRNLLKNKLNYKCWSSTKSCSSQKGKKKLTDIIKIDFANLNRKGKWDYIILQNHRTKGSSIIDSDVAIYNTVKRTLPTSKNFVLNLTTYAKGIRSDRLEPHMKAIKKVNGSLMYTAKIFSKYDSKWTKKLLIGDGPGHQSTKGAYLFACITYAKIYGRNDLAKSNNASNYIAIYGGDAVSQYNHRTGNSKYGAMKVTKSDAKELQALVYKYYKKYVLYY